ncbi:MAG: hypothetical protein NXH83_14170 [Rhodobacteraceae bacterium]|nr:hypothetical protein [Paracoccaceae bacterium]
MTTLITRLYAEEKAADSVASRLRWEGLPGYAIQVITGTDKARLADRMTRAKVHESAIEAYTAKVAEGAALLVVAATYKPLGAARITRETVAASTPVEVEGVTEEHYFPDGPDHAPSILRGHPRFMTLDLGMGDYEGKPISVGLCLPLLSKGPRKNRVFRGGRHMSRMFWPMPLVTRKRKANSAMQGTRHMSRLFWPMPLITRGRRSRSVIRDGALPLSRALGWPTVSRRP